MEKLKLIEQLRALANRSTMPSWELAERAGVGRRTIETLRSGRVDDLLLSNYEAILTVLKEARK